MTKIISSMGLAVVLLVGCDQQADIVVAPDSPISTLTAAVAQARSLRASGAVKDRAITIAVKKGRYPLSEPLVLGPDDSHLHFYGPGWTEAILDGGEQLPPFVAERPNLWVARVPEGLAFDQLWVNGQRAMRARTPNRHYFYMKDADYPNPYTAFFATAEDVAPLARLTREELAQVVVGVWQSWTMGYGRIQTFDPVTNRIQLVQAIGYPLFHWNRTCPRYTLENYRAALDAPGEWFLDVAAHKLYYIPRAGETVANTVAVAPIARGLIELRGDRAQGRIVRDIRFTGLGFEHAGYTLDAKGLKAAQSVANVTEAALRANDAEDVVLTNCRVAHTGAHGVWMRAGCRYVRMTHCLIEDLGAGGVYFGDTRADLKNRANNAAYFELTDSIIRHGGRLMTGGIGVWLGKATDCKVEHNAIYDFFYTGVSSGWTWGYAETVTRNHKINHNRIHHIGQGVLSDMGGVYTLGDHTGSEVRNNWIWEVNGYEDNGSPAWGLYTDEGSKGFVFCDNLVEKCRAGAIHQHYGMENVYSNNICATFRDCGVWRSRNENHITIRVMNNIFWWTQPEAGTYRGGGGYESLTDLPADGNVYWCTAGSVATNAFKGADWAAWRRAGKDAQGVCADPYFVAPEKGDWRLRPDSPALKAGFKPFDWRDSGVRTTDAKWVACAEECTWDPFEDLPKAPPYRLRRVKMDFENRHVGPVRDGMGGFLPFRLQMGKPGGFAITDKDVMQGRRALVFTDSPENKQGYCPHMSLGCNMTSGTAVVRFAFKNVHSGTMQFEARDYTGSTAGRYKIGCKLHHQKGQLWAQDQPLVELKDGVWAEVEIRLVLSGKGKERVIVKVTPQGGVPTVKTFDRFSNAQFKNLTWVGFMTYGRGDGIWQLDDFELTNPE